MPKHTTSWEDGRCAGLRCDEVDTTTVISDDEWDKCSICGREVTLVWNVSVRER